MNIFQGMAQGMGGYQQAANQMGIPYGNQFGALANSQQHAQQQIWPPLPQFEENVPDDELEFEGKLTRWNPYALLAQYKKNHFGIECCQRCLMI